ncbi:MAPEG family protein [Coralloluteibacterium thermophilus]|uniref:MAPEG family protein n=1 Tax=Coralloluteibacterium thermophilum TaxID=2707049 RepID=A0ABV9NKH2_9GAMM
MSEGIAALAAPVFVMAGLTFLVWLRLYAVRLSAMRRLRIPPQAVASSAGAAAHLADTRASDNFRNLLELPVLFYAALGLAALAGQGDRTVLVLAWLFVATRVLHSAIHCTVNRVVPRFLAYQAGAWTLWALWAVLALRFYR